MRVLGSIPRLGTKKPEANASDFFFCITDAAISDIEKTGALKPQPDKEVFRIVDFVRQNPMLVIDVDKSEFAEKKNV